MDFRQFRYFVTTAEELHFARAAERLGMSQPALSQQIKALELQLGAQLFYRTKRRIELTETGMAFLQEARATLEMSEKAIRTARDMARGEAGSIDIGYVGSAMYAPLFPQLLRAYRKRHPAVRLTLHERPVLAQIDAVHKRQFDLAVIRAPLPKNMLPDELDCLTLSAQRLVAVLPTRHRLARAESLSLEALAADEFLAFRDPDGIGLGHALLELCRASGFDPKITQRVSEVATLISLVAVGFGVSLVPEIVSHLQLPGVCYVPLSGDDVLSKLMVIYRRFERSTTVRELLNDIQTSAAGEASANTLRDSSIARARR